MTDVGFLYKIIICTRQCHFTSRFHLNKIKCICIYIYIYIHFTSLFILKIKFATNIFHNTVVYL